MSLKTFSITTALLLYTLLIAVQAVRADSLILGDVASVDLNGAFEFLEDAEHVLTLDDLQRSEQAWQRAPDRVFNQGYSASSWWLRLQIVNPLARHEARLIELAYAVLDYVDLYIVDERGVVREYHTGDMRDFASRPIDSRFFVFPLDWQPQQQLTIYLRLQSSSSMQAPLSMWQKDAYTSHEIRSNSLQGLYYGGMLVIVIYNLLLLLVLWERGYLFYVGFVISIPLYFASLSGYAYQYFWTDATGWNSHAIPVFISLSIIFGALFTREILTLRRVSIPVDRLIIACAIVGAVMLLISIFAPYQISIGLLGPLTILACLGDFTAGVYCWYRRVDAARIYVIAWACFLTGAIILSLNKMSLLPTNALTEHAIQIGSVLEAVLLSFALAERINTERRLRFEAQEETLATQRALNENLERRVAERTEKLAELNRQLEALSNTDQLTGLKNRRFLEVAGREEWQRCQRYGHPLSVLMLDIDHFKAVNDRYGHAAGDACLRQVAELLLRGLRTPIDIAARYGGEEFCLVLPETDEEGAMRVAERLRQSIAGQPVVAGDVEFRVTASIGVCSAIPSRGGQLEELLDNADKGLYLSKAGGRNRAMRCTDDSAA